MKTNLEELTIIAWHGLIIGESIRVYSPEEMASMAERYAAKMLERLNRREKTPAGGSGE